MIHTITTEWQHNMVFTSDNPSGLSVQIDSSEEFGGTQSGLRPKALMLSSLAGCSGLDVISFLTKMRVTVDNFKIINKFSIFKRRI